MQTQIEQMNKSFPFQIYTLDKHIKKQIKSELKYVGTNQLS